MYYINSNKPVYDINMKEVDKMLDKIVLKQQEKEKIKTSADYINWLVNFSKEEKIITNTDLLYNADRLKKEDKSNADKLLLFIDVIIDYAEENNIEALDNEDGYLYYVNYNGQTLEIFIGPMYYHVKYEDKKIDEVIINYEDILKSSIKQKSKKLLY